MLNLVIAFLILGGQIYFYRSWEPTLLRRLGRRLTRAVHYGLIGFQLAVLAIVSLDNNWPVARLWGQAGPAGRVVALAAGIWIAGWSGAAALSLIGHLLSRRRKARPAGSADGPSRRTFLATAARTAAVAAPFGVAGYGTLITRADFELREIAFPVPKLHPDLRGLRIALLTDIHFSPYLTLPELDRTIAMANETRPHLTLVTGDFITRSGDPLDTCLSRLANLKADAGIFGCLGNHETYARCEDYTESAARRLGIQILRKRAELLPFGAASLNLVGVDYQWQRGPRPYLVGAGQFVRPGVVNLLMSHNPDVFPVAVKLGYDLVVGGHTHGGQVTVEILKQTLSVSRFFTPFVAGLYRRGSSALYVSRGIGTINLPMRVGARPEVTLLRLSSA